MLTLAEKWCSKRFAKMAFGIESQVWYYDGARVYFQIADYTKEPQWNECALNIARQYRDYILSNNGRIPGWRVFPQGLRMAYERTGDESFKTAVMLLSQKSTYALSGGDVSEKVIRETAYIVQAYVEAERLGKPAHRLSRAVDYLIGHFDVLFSENGAYAQHQTFFDGLAAQALIDYYELKRDARVPPTIKRMLDWLWSNAWLAEQNQLIINPEPRGPKCDWGCRKGNTDLINLTVPAFAWYANVTGDLTYLKRGDTMFSHALDTDISYSGKIFSQNYRWSYFAYRAAMPTNGGDSENGARTTPAFK